MGSGDEGLAGAGPRLPMLWQRARSGAPRPPHWLRPRNDPKTFGVEPAGIRSRGNRAQTERRPAPYMALLQPREQQP